MSIDGQRILVTGGTGFIGSALVRRLIKEGAEVHVFSQRAALGTADPSGRLHQHAVDLESGPAVAQAVVDIQPSVVYHLASYGVRPDARDVDRLWGVNVIGLAHVLQACESHPPQWIVNTGSWSEYGVSQDPHGRMKETDACEPLAPYALTKYAATQWAGVWSRTRRIPLVTLRLFSVYGEGEAAYRFVSTLVQALKQKTPARVGDPSQVRDFICLDDVVEAYLAVLDLAPIYGDVVNVGRGDGLSLGQIVTGLQGRGLALAAEWNQSPPRPWDVPKALADMEKAHRLLPWRAHQALVDWIEAQIWTAPPA